MEAQIDDCGRIQLPASLRAQLGLKPGDVVTLEDQNGKWLLAPSGNAQGLAWEGNVLVHQGRMATSAEQTLAALREERAIHLSEGLQR